MNNSSSAHMLMGTTTTEDELNLFDNHNSYFTASILALSILVAFLATFLNLFIILTFVKTPVVRETPSNVLIVSLAISDFGVGMLSAPLVCVHQAANLIHREDLDRRAIGNAFTGITMLLFIISFFSMSAITVDRFLAVHLHLRYQEIITTRRSTITVLCIWISSFLLCGLTIKSRAVEYRTVFLSVICAIVFANVFFLFKISRVIHRHSVQIQAQQQSVQQSIDMPRYKKSVNTMHYIMCGFVICYLPFLGMLFVIFISPSTKDKEWTTFALSSSIVVVMFNSIMNPLIYCWRIEEMRNAAKKVVRKIWNQDN